MARGLRSLIHHPIRATGVHRSSGGGGIPDPLTLPATFDFDAETTGQTPSWVTNTGTDTATVEAYSIEGHSKALKLPGTNGAVAYVDMGGNIDPTAGFRVQVLGYRSALYAPKYMFVSPGPAAGESDTDLILGEIVESSSDHTLRNFHRKEGTTWDTGQVHPGGGINGTGTSWTYWRWQYDPSDGVMTFHSYNTGGTPHAGYPKTQNPAAGWQTSVVGFDYISFVSASYYETRVAEIWIGALATAWPTPGTPTT